MNISHFVFRQLWLEKITQIGYNFALMKNIWQQLSQAKRPFFVLAPLDDVTDTVFRQVVLKAGRPDLMMTEFISADAYARGGVEIVESKLRFAPDEQPVIAQIWGKEPAHYESLAREVAKRGFVGIDINMGCPEKNIVRQGCCSGLIRTPEKAAEIIAATKQGAGQLPVSVKTRLGFDRVITEEWLGFLIEQNLSALTIHGRTAKEMSKVPARWDEIAKAVVLRDRLASQTVIIGNGDVESRAHGHQLAKASRVDGVMVGRGIFQDIFIFADERQQYDLCNRLELLLYHLDLHERTWADTKRFIPLRKFFKIYVNGFDGAAKLRAQLMEATEYEATRKLIKSQIKSLRPT